MFQFYQYLQNHKLRTVAELLQRCRWRPRTQLLYDKSLQDILEATRILIYLARADYNTT